MQGSLYSNRIMLKGNDEDISRHMSNDM